MWFEEIAVANKGLQIRLLINKLPAVLILHKMNLMLSLNNNIENVPMYWHTRKKNTPETALTAFPTQPYRNLR